jgi:quercetin dioxygenase-like cupin family protein
MEGRPVITVADKRYASNKGDVLIVPAGGIHDLRADTDRAVVVGVLTVRT